MDSLMSKRTAKNSEGNESSSLGGNFGREDSAIPPNGEVHICLQQLDHVEGGFQRSHPDYLFVIERTMKMKMKMKMKEEEMKNRVP
jgi:hypothetical protein